MIRDDLAVMGQQVYHFCHAAPVMAATLLFALHIFCVVITALDKAALSTLSDRRAVSCIKFIGKVWPGNPLYPLIHNRVVPISTSVCLRSGSSSRPMATRTERFSNFVSVKY